MPRVHSHLEHVQATLPSQKEKFAVKREAVDLLLAKQSLAGDANKSLQTALRVFERQAQDQPGEPAKGSTQDASHARALNLDLLSVNQSRSDDDVPLRVERGQKFFHRGHRIGEVGVGEDDYLAARCHKSPSDTIAFPAVGLIAEAPDGPVAI